jgi:hypothetical protein
MRLDAPLGEEAQCFSSVSAFLDAKDLNFHEPCGRCCSFG